MNGGEVALIILLVIILLGLIGLTVYLVYRNEHNKNQNNNNNNGNTGTTGTTGTTGNTGINPLPGASGSTGLVNGNFAIRPVSAPTLRIAPGENVDGLYVTDSTTQSCLKYTWQNNTSMAPISMNGLLTGNTGPVFNALVNLGGPNDLGPGDTGPNFMQAIVGQNNTTFQTILQLQNSINGNPSSWYYNPNNKTWCELNTTNCLFYDGNPNVISIQNGNIVSNLTVQTFVSGLSGFQWNNDNNITPPNCQ
jgi:hypothetical protein